MDIQALAGHDEVAPALVPRPATATATAAAAAAAGMPFDQLVSDGLTALNGQLKASEADLQRLALGEAPNLHEVMVRLEEARISFQLMLQVRNRMLEAYQDVMKMQI